MSDGLRYDDGKARIDLVPAEAIIALAEHYAKGASKYEERNWEKGMDFHKCYNSMMRHALAWHQGEDNDPETGTNHMIAAAWNAIALYIYQIRNIGMDDRPKTVNQIQMSVLNNPNTFVPMFVPAYIPKNCDCWDCKISRGENV